MISRPARPFKVFVFIAKKHFCKIHLISASLSQGAKGTPKRKFGFHALQAA
jgi:hypothetical protein